MRSKPWSWWIDFILVNCVLFLAESARGVVLGTLWSYVHTLGGTTMFLAVLISIFSAGRLVASIFFGVLSDYLSTKTVLIASCISCVGGNFLFIFAGNSWVMSKWLLLISRILTGFGTGMLSVARTHVSVTTPSDERTLWMSWLGITQFVGFAVTPVIGSIDLEFSLGILDINVYTFATFLLLILEAVLIICLFLFMSKQSTNDTNQSINQPNDAVTLVPVPSDIERNSSAEYAALTEGSLVSPDNMSCAQTNNNQTINQSFNRFMLHPIAEPEVYLNDEVVLTGSKQPRQPPIKVIRCVSEPHLSNSQTNNQTNNQTRPVLGQRSYSLPVVLMPPKQLSSNQSTPAAIISPFHSPARPPPLLLTQSSNQSINQSIVDSNNQSNSEVIVYVEDGRTPDGRDALMSPHRFILSTNLSNNQSDTQLALSGSSDDQSINQSKLARFKSIIHQCTVPMVFVVLNLSGRGVLSVAEAYGTQLYNQVTGIAPSDGQPDDTDTGPASNFFLILGCLGLLVFLIMNRLTKKIDETTLLLLSFVAMGIGFGVLVDFEDYSIDIYDFSAGMCLVWVIGTPISQTLSVSMLSKHFTSEQLCGRPVLRGVGFWMGMITTSGSIGRIVFPLISGALYEPFGVSAALLFTSLASFATCALIIVALKAWRPYTKAVKNKLGCCFRSVNQSDDHADEIQVKTEWPGTFTFSPISSRSNNQSINQSIKRPVLTLCQSSPLACSLDHARPMTTRSQSIPVLNNRFVHQSLLQTQ